MIIARKKDGFLATVFVSFYLLWLWSAVMADDVNRPCPIATLPSTNPPSGVVKVTILSVEPSDDLEGDDNCVPWYDNRADIYGYITIDGEKFPLPQKTDDNFPHWEDISFTKKVSTSDILISIEMLEYDDVTDNDVVDINPDPAPGKHSLNLNVDLCGLLIFGDIWPPKSLADVIESEGDGWCDDPTLPCSKICHGAKIRFKVELEDGRPLTTDDLALVGVDLVQVLYQRDVLVAGKPTILMVQVANNFQWTMSTSVKVLITGPGISLSKVFKIDDLGAGEVRKIYSDPDHPLIFPPGGTPYDIKVWAELDAAAEAKFDDCRLYNNYTNGYLRRKVVRTCAPALLWSKVGTLIDLPENFVPDGDFREIIDLGNAFIKGTYPIADLPSDVSPFRLVTPATAALDWLFTILDVFKIPTDCALPFIFVFELQSIPILTGHDRLMGMVHKGWFDRFAESGLSCWSEVGGLSLGEFAPYAVIFLPNKMTRPVHELGHTYGLSTDASLKDSWVCKADWPILGKTACGIIGGFDEYNHKDPVLQKGNPSAGFWIRQGGEPAALLPLLNSEQCNSHCFMGRSNRDLHKDWGVEKRWIDDADYDHLIKKVCSNSYTSVIFVSGMIALNDSTKDEDIYLGSWYHLSQGVPDRDDTSGLYAFRFLDQGGSTIQEVGLPLIWNTPDFEKPLPVSFFGLRLPFPESTASIQIWNRATGKMLGKRDVSQNIPAVQTLTPAKGQVIQQGDSVLVKWVGSDLDGDQLTYTILAGPDGQEWWPVAHQLTAPSHSMRTDDFTPGFYFLKVLATDGIHVGESQLIQFSVQGCLAKAGDVNGDTCFSLADIIGLVNIVFKGSAEPSPLCLGDANASGGYSNLADIIYMVNYIFKGGPRPGTIGECCR